MSIFGNLLAKKSDRELKGPGLKKKGNFTVCVMAGSLP